VLPQCARLAEIWVGGLVAAVGLRAQPRRGPARGCGLQRVCSRRRRQLIPHSIGLHCACECRGVAGPLHFCICGAQKWAAPQKSCSTSAVPVFCAVEYRLGRENFSRCTNEEKGRGWVSKPGFGQRFLAKSFIIPSPDEFPPRAQWVCGRLSEDLAELSELTRFV